MKRVNVLVAAFAISALIALAGSANAGVISWSAWWVDDSSVDTANSDWNFDYGQEAWTVWEDYDAEAPDGNIIGIDVETDSDPIIHITKIVENNSTYEWTDYHIEITGSAGVSYVTGSATSDKFQTIIESGNLIDFYAPQSVPIGDSVTLEFDIQIPAGVFSFDVHQMPTPEPTSLLLLGLAGAVVFRRR